MSAPSAVLEQEAAPPLRAIGTVDWTSLTRYNYCPDCGSAPAAGEMIEDCAEAWTMIPFPPGSWAC